MGLERMWTKTDTVHSDICIVACELQKLADFCRQTVLQSWRRCWHRHSLSM